MAKRKVNGMYIGRCEIKVLYDPMFKEYNVRTYKDGKRYGGDGYYTDSRSDALATMRADAKHLEMRSACRGSMSRSRRRSSRRSSRR